MFATAIVDASWCPHTRIGAWAAWVAIDGTRHKHSGVFKKRPRHSQMAEHWAALNGLLLALEVGAGTVLVQTDCKVLVTMPLSDFVKPIKGPCSIVGILRKHVKGHTAGKDPRHWVNNWCDETARGLMREARDNGNPF